MADVLYIDKESGHRFKIADSKKKPSRLYINKRQLSHVTGISESTINYWLAKRKITYYKVGGRVVFDLRDVINFMEQFRVPAKK